MVFFGIHEKTIMRLGQCKKSFNFWPPSLFTNRPMLDGGRMVQSSDLVTNERPGQHCDDQSEGSECVWRQVFAWSGVAPPLSGLREVTASTNERPVLGLVSQSEKENWGPTHVTFCQTQCRDD